MRSLLVLAALLVALPAATVNIEFVAEHLVFDDVRSRLASILLELAHDFGEVRGGEVLIWLPLTQFELSTLIGATRQTVNATLADFRNEGLVDREEGRINVRSAEGLRRALRAAPRRRAKAPPAAS